jgi:hypothetical protein
VRVLDSALVEDIADGVRILDSALIEDIADGVRILDSALVEDITNRVRVLDSTLIEDIANRVRVLDSALVEDIADGVRGLDNRSCCHVRGNQDQNEGGVELQHLCKNDSQNGIGRLIDWLVRRKALVFLVAKR